MVGRSSGWRHWDFLDHESGIESFSFSSFVTGGRSTEAALACFVYALLHHLVFSWFSEHRARSRGTLGCIKHLCHDFSNGGIRLFRCYKAVVLTGLPFWFLFSVFQAKENDGEGEKRRLPKMGTDKSESKSVHRTKNGLQVWKRLATTELVVLYWLQCTFPRATVCALREGKTKYVETRNASHRN